MEVHTQQHIPTHLYIGIVGLYDSTCPHRLRSRLCEVLFSVLLSSVLCLGSVMFIAFSSTYQLIHINFEHSFHSQGWIHFTKHCKGAHGSQNQR